MDETTQKLYRTVRLEHPVARFLHYKDFLTQAYSYLKDNQPSFSYLKFASDMGFGERNNFLRLVISGQRTLTTKSADRIADAFNFSSTERKYWLTMVKYCNAKRGSERDPLLKKLAHLKAKLQPQTIDKSRLQYFSEWHHSVIREMAARTDFKMEAKWIQDTIGFPIRLEQINQSLELLTRLGLIVFDAKLKRYTRSDESIDTGHDARGLAFMSYHHNMIDLGRLSVAKVARGKRQLQAATLYLSEEQIHVLKEKVKKIFDEALELDTETTGGEHTVVQFNIQMFPCTK